MAYSRAVIPLPAGATRVAHSRAVSVLYLLEPVGLLILELWCLLPAGATKAHSRAVVSSTCWSQ